LIIDLGKKDFKHREAVEEKKKKKKKKIQCVFSGLFWRLGCFDFCVFVFVHVSGFVFCGF